jgi:hypothetical protein
MQSLIQQKASQSVRRQIRLAGVDRQMADRDPQQQRMKPLPQHRGGGRAHDRGVQQQKPSVSLPAGQPVGLQKKIRHKVGGDGQQQRFFHGRQLPSGVLMKRVNLFRLTFERQPF